MLYAPSQRERLTCRGEEQGREIRREGKRLQTSSLDVRPGERGNAGRTKGRWEGGRAGRRGTALTHTDGRDDVSACSKTLLLSAPLPPATHPPAVSILSLLPVCVDASPPPHPFLLYPLIHALFIASVRVCVCVCVCSCGCYILSTMILILLANGGHFWDGRTFWLVLTTLKDCLRVEGLVGTLQLCLR